MSKNFQNEKLKCQIRNLKLYQLFGTLVPKLPRYFSNIQRVLNRLVYRCEEKMLWRMKLQDLIV
jgi:hypothetical protein